MTQRVTYVKKYTSFSERGVFDGSDLLDEQKTTRVNLKRSIAEMNSMQEKLELHIFEYG